MDEIFQGSASGTDADDIADKYLTFWTDGQLFGIPIADVVQIIGVQEITAVPQFPSYAKGLINLRGNVIPVIDIRLRLEKAEIPYDDRTCTIVTSIDDKDMGFIVDQVDEVTNIGSDQISPPPKMSADRANSYITGIGRRGNQMILLLDTTRILSANAMEGITNFVSEETI